MSVLPKPSLRVLFLLNSTFSFFLDTFSWQENTTSSTLELHGLMPRGKTGGGNHAMKGADWEERELPSRYVCGGWEETLHWQDADWALHRDTVPGAPKMGRAEDWLQTLDLLTSSVAPKWRFARCDVHYSRGASPAWWSRAGDQGRLPESITLFSSFRKSKQWQK